VRDCHKKWLSVSRFKGGLEKKEISLKACYFEPFFSFAQLEANHLKTWQIVLYSKPFFPTFCEDLSQFFNNLLECTDCSCSGLCFADVQSDRTRVAIDTEEAEAYDVCKARQSWRQYCWHAKWSNPAYCRFEKGTKKKHTFDRRGRKENEHVRLLDSCSDV